MVSQRSLVQVKGVDFWYGQKQILHSVDLDVHEKKITALIGPSGCGKSTLLRSLNRMNDLVATSKISGHVSYGEQDVYSEDYDVIDLRKKIGMVFQKPNPFPLSIFENVCYGLRVQGVKDKKNLSEAVEDSLKKADLWEEVKDRLDSSAFGLSGGQQQRLCIARALAVKPDVLLLDEPCSALDPISTAKVEKLLVDLKGNQTIVIVTHNMHQAKRISDYTCYLYQGKVIEFGETQDIFSKPKEKLTADYLKGEFG